MLKLSVSSIHESSTGVLSLASHPYFSAWCACMRGERGRGKGRKNTSGKMCKSVCRNVGKANQIRAFKVIEYGYVKSTRRRLIYKYLLSRASEESTEVIQLLGYAELSVNQAQVMTYFLSGRDVFVRLPVCSGKSLCYCLVPILRRTSWYG